MTDRTAAARPAGRPRGAAVLALLILGLVLVGSVAPGRVAGAPPPAVGSASGAGASDWATAGGSNNRSGYTPIDGPSVGGLISEVSPLGQDTPAIRSGVAANATNIYFADALGAVFDYNRSAHPARIWNASVGTDPVTPALANGSLYDGGSDGWLTALNATTGRSEWRTAIGGPLVGGIAVVPTTAGPEVLAGSTAGWVLALTATTGHLVANYSVGGPLAGAPAIEGTTLIVVSTAGRVTAYDLGDATPTVLWNTTLSAGNATGPAVSNGLVVVGDGSGNVTAIDLADGALAWRTSIRSVIPDDTLFAAPAIGDGRVFVATQLGALIALDVANGSEVWNRTTEYTGYLALASPAVAPNGVYFSDASQDIVDLSPGTGNQIWTFSLSYTPSYATPTVDHGELFEGTDLGVLLTIGRPGGPVTYPVSGVVDSPNGTLVAGAQVAAGGQTIVVGPDGAFTLHLTNGTYDLMAGAPGFYETFQNITVAGPLGNLSVLLVPVPFVVVRGTIVDGDSGQPLGEVTVTFYGADEITSATSAPNGTFRIRTAVGFDSLDIGEGGGYGGLNEVVNVPPTGLPNLTLSIVPIFSVPGDVRAGAIAGALGAVGAALAFAAAYRDIRRRRELRQPTGLLGPFGRYIAMRILLLPAQAIAVLTVLYLFGTVLPAIARKTNPCLLAPASICSNQGWTWGVPWQAVEAVLGGLGYFVWNLFTLNWGEASYGYLTQPATTFLYWWGPDSIQLALFALPLSAGLAWLVGLYGGAKRDGAIDVGARVLSAAGLLLPSFLLVLLFLGTFYGGFLQTFGDTPYGILPTTSWWGAHGGYPAWIGEGANTLPTGLPLVDGAIHGDWSFEVVVLAKTIWQAAAIAVVYTAIFLRYARSVVAEAFQEPHLTAARARGVAEPTILWRHTGRRVLPLMLLVFGATLPAYVGTQAVVEALTNDTGLGTLLLGELTHVGLTGFGFSTTQHIVTGNLYQVMVFLLVMIVLVGNIVADAVARYLDPRLLRRSL